MLCLSNKEPVSDYLNHRDQICFINYDYKNNLESFLEKNNNPLDFPKIVFIEAEKKIPLSSLPIAEYSNTFRKPEIKAVISKEEYLRDVKSLKQHIQLGDIYEINYCITFEAFDVEINPIEFYFRLNEISHAPFSALVKLDHQYIFSSSPELFLSRRKDRLITKPIKGTAKRSNNTSEDDHIKMQLQQSLKERTENVMIVDVARNDLSRIALKASVQVDSLFKIESYEQVHQMVSEVSCMIDGKESIENIIKATFPMASMTGAPKIKAMQLIDECEVYNRGPYSGALGYINENGNFDLSVLIRSVFYDESKKYLSFSVGSAITDRCSPEEEYDECLLKAKALLQSLS